MLDYTQISTAEQMLIAACNVAATNPNLAAALRMRAESTRKKFFEVVAINNSRIAAKWAETNDEACDLVRARCYFSEPLEIMSQPLPEALCSDKRCIPIPTGTRTWC